MFFVLPLSVKDPSGRDTVPLANSLLVAANVLVFFLNHSLGWPLAGVGRGTSFWTILAYGFSHLTIFHLLGNLWVLWLVGNPVNRRLGDGYYLAAYLGSVVALGTFAWLFLDGLLVGSSGAIFCVIFLFLMLLPRAVVTFGYLALFPFTLLIGLVSRPRHGVFWFLRRDTFDVPAWMGLFLVPLLELWGLIGQWNWTNLGHLLGLACGVVVVLLLPSEITMRRRPVPGRI